MFAALSFFRLHRLPPSWLEAYIQPQRVLVFLRQHHSQAQGPGGDEPGLGGVSGPAAGGVSGALRRGVALGAGRRGPEAGDRSGTRRYRRLQGRLQPGQ